MQKLFRSIEPCEKPETKAQGATPLPAGYSNVS